MAGIRMPNAGEVSLSMRNAEDAFWQSRATVIGKRGEFFCTTNIRQLAKDIRNAPASAFANRTRHREILTVAVATLACGRVADAIAITPFRFYAVRRPTRDVGAGLPEAGGAVVGRLEPGGGSDVEPRGTIVDFPCAWDASSFLLSERAEGSDADHAEPRDAHATCIQACPNAAAYFADARPLNFGGAPTPDAEVKPDCVCSDEPNPDCVPYGPYCLYGIDMGSDT